MRRETHVAIRQAMGSLVVPRAAGCLSQMYRETRGCVTKGLVVGYFEFDGLLAL